MTDRGYKLGKKPFEPSDKDFMLKDVLKTTLPSTPTKSFGYGTLYENWQMLGNDQYGDCVFAGSDHETMLWNKIARHPVKFTEDNALSDYSAVTGFDPNDPNSDQGTNVRDALDYRRKTGLIDSLGSRHKIDAFVQIDAGDFDLMLQCVWTFGVVGIGFNVPAFVMDDFDQGKIWDVQSRNASIEGGHYVPMVGGNSSKGQATFITWAARTVMTKAFYEKYNDEAWVPLTQEELLPGGLNTRHIDWQNLNNMLQSL